MPTLKERFTDLLLGDERHRLRESAQLLYNAYLEGPFVLPPDQLLAQLKEQDAALLTDLVHQLYWEQLGTPGYTQDLTAERTRAIDESRRLWKYNPLAQWMIWLWTNYGFGENIVVVPEDESAVETWEEFWKADRNQAVLAQDRIADKLSNWLLVDGDRFLAFYASTLDGETTIRRINTKEIVEIVTDPDDSNLPLFYKRQWSDAKNRQLTWYYPDWEAFFRGDLDRAELPRDAVRADEQNDKTTVVILHISFNGKDEDSLYGWPLLAAGSPWIRSQKRHLENRLAVSASKAMYVRKATVKGGSRAVDSVIANLQSALSSTQSVETNPPAVAGSTLVENQAVTTTDFPMTTGASDAKTDGEMFAWIALLSGGVFPHYAGMDAHLFTRQGMEKPLYMQWSRYKTFWSAQFRKKVRIVLRMNEEYGGASYSTYDAEVSTDRLVEVDLGTMAESLGRIFNTMFSPQVEAGIIPGEVAKNILQSSWRTILQALGVDAENVIGDEAWEVEEEPEKEEGLEEAAFKPGDIVTPTSSRCALPHGEYRVTEYIEPMDGEHGTVFVEGREWGVSAEYLKLEEPELAESIVLALQNYRSGLIDADDLVAFLVPSKLEEGGPGSGWFAPPRGTHVGKVGAKTASQMRAELKRDTKRKQARIEQLDEQTQELSDRMPNSYSAYKAWQLAKGEGRPDVKKLEAEYLQLVEVQNKLMDKMAKVESERWKVKNSIRSAARERLGVANPAEFKTNMGRLRKGREDLRQGSDAFADLMGRGTLDDETVTIHTTTGNRGRYDSNGIYLPPINRRSKVMVHELGHWLEDRDPDVRHKAIGFLLDRTGNEKAISLRKAMGNPNYRVDEMTKENKFMNAYAGKQYLTEGLGHIYATEIVSMGVEHMYSEPIKFATEDPGHFDFIYDLMRGE